MNRSRNRLLLLLPSPRPVLSLEVDACYDNQMFRFLVKYCLEGTDSIASTGDLYRRYLDVGRMLVAPHDEHRGLMSPHVFLWKLRDCGFTILDPNQKIGRPKRMALGVALNPDCN